MVFLRIVWVVMIGLLCNSNLDANSKREFRGAWIHVVGNTTIRTMPAAQVQKMLTDALDSIQKVGCNAVIFQVRPTADAFYFSEIEPWSRYLTGVQGKAPVPFWDPLAFVVEQAHQRGLEVHAWCNPYRVTMDLKDTLSSDHIYFKCPEIFVKYGKQIYFNPTEPAARAHTVKVVADIVRRYDIEAIHFDDYFYPYPLSGTRFKDDAAFEKYAAKQGFKTTHPNLKPTDVEYDRVVKGDWRRHNVELLIRELNDTIKSIKPWVRFGISPFGIHRNKKDHASGSATNGLSNYDELFADVPGWAQKGYIDYYVPQLYWVIGHDRADYKTLIHWWNKQHIKGHLYIGQSISTMKNQIKPKMRLSRELKQVSGNVWWPGWALMNDSGKVNDSLRIRYQQHSALIPAYSELDAVAPAPLVISKEGRSIVWKQLGKEAADPLQKALFYAVYSFPKGVKTQVEDTRYLLKITNANSFNVIEENPRHAAGCHYVVTVIDRCWNESVPGNELWY